MNDNEINGFELGTQIPQTWFLMPGVEAVSFLGWSDGSEDAKMDE